MEMRWVGRGCEDGKKEKDWKGKRKGRVGRRT
jgi:hypothetical protein